GVVGTSVVEEMGEMKGGRWSKLLRILEGHPFERVGGSVPIRVDVRVVAATNQPLEENVRAGTFRRDLFFRLQVVEVQVAPLRDRRGDIQIGRASCRERGEISVVAVSLKKKRGG